MSIIELEVRTSSSDVAAPMVAAGGGHTVALKKDGTVWTWGNNGVGQLGDGTSVTKAYPVQVFAGEENDSSTGYLNNIIQISAGSNYVIALKKDGTVFTWGQNIYGQLGNGSSVNSMLPVQVKSADGNSFLTDIVQISAGYVHSMALKKDGTVWTWGRNDGGQLGNNNTSNKSLPVQVKGGASGSEYLTDVVQVTAGNWHSMALKANGTVYAWGWGQYGQLGNGYTTNRNDTDYYSSEKIYSAPVQVLNGEQTSETGYLKEVVQIDAMGGTGHNDRNRFGTSLAVTESKEVYGWGNSWYGALGVNSSIVSKPVRVGTDISNAVQVAGGGKSGSDDYHVYSIGNTGYTYILKEDGTVSSLGYNVNGELGNGSKTSTINVCTVQGLTNVAQIAGSKNGNFGAAVKKDGTIWTWGQNTYGQLGNGTTDTPKTKPIQAGTEGSNTLVVHKITIDSSIDNTTPMGNIGVYGDNNTFVSTVTLRGDDSSATKKFDAFSISSVDVSRKFNLNLAVDEEQYLKATEKLTYQSMNPEIVTVDASGNVRPAHKGKYGSTVILIQYNYNDLGVTNTFKGMVRVNIVPYMGIASPMVAAGGAFTVALKYDGTVWTWGNNTNGELGRGDKNSVYSPVQVKSADGNSYLTDIIFVSAGSNHTLALRKDGTVWTWGLNTYGQLGNNTTTGSSLPVQVKIANGDLNLTNVVSISAGYQHNIALRKDGTVWAWGRNGGGQLGNSNTNNQLLPVQVKGGASGSEYLTDVVQVTAGNWHSMALKANGTVYAWGWGQYGQLGNGYTTNSYDTDYYSGEKIYSAPVQVLNGAQTSETGYLKEVVQIDTMGGTGRDGKNRFGTSLAVTESKEVYGWGNSLYGALGVNSSIVSTPVRVATGISTAVQVAGGSKSGSDDYHVNSIGNTGYTYILKEDGTVSSLGYNVKGELGNGAKASTTAVQKVSNLTEIMQVAGSKNGNFGAAVKEDGTVWTWGANTNGQLGNGTTDSPKLNAIQVGSSGSNAMRISYGSIMHGTDVLEKFDDPNQIIGNITIAEDDTFVIDKTKITSKQSFSLLPDTDTLTPSGITITSFNENLATVNSNTGVVTPVKGAYGTAIIIIKAGSVQSLIRINIKPSVTDNPESVAKPMVATGASHTIALKYDGTVWTWGNNTNGQLGNNSTENSSSPVQVKSADGNGYLTNIIEISAGSGHNMALSKDGTVFTWGSNAYGQLGNGSSVNSMLPVQVKSADGNSFLTDIVQISAGYVHSMALKKDGTVLAWGRNDGGQLGNNNTSNKSLPVQVKKAERQEANI